jgi:LEA14-like dessication related protein
MPNLINSSVVRLTALVFASLVIFLTGAHLASAATAPAVSIASIDRIEWKNNRATLDITLDVTNPSGVDVQLSSLKFHCVFGGSANASGESRSVVTVPSNDHASVPVRLTVSGDSLVALVILASNSTALDYRLDGTAELGPMGLEVPFSRTGRISLPH